MPDRPIPPATAAAMDAVTGASDRIAVETTPVRLPFADLPGISHEIAHDQWLPGQAVVRVEQRMPATNPPARSKLTGFIAVPTELLNDSAIPLAQLIEAQMDRTFRPWRYPDPNPFPNMDRMVAPVTTRLVGTRPGRWMLRRRPVRRLLSRTA